MDMRQIQYEVNMGHKGTYRISMDLYIYIFVIYDGIYIYIIYDIYDLYMTSI